VRERGLFGRLDAAPILIEVPDSALIPRLYSAGVALVLTHALRLYKIAVKVRELVRLCCPRSQARPGIAPSTLGHHGDRATAMAHPHTRRRQSIVHRAQRHHSRTRLTLAQLVAKGVSFRSR